MATNLPEGTDTIIDGAAAADTPDDTPGFGASGAGDGAAPATGAGGGGGPGAGKSAGNYEGAGKDDGAGKGEPNAAATPPTAGDAKAAIGDAKAKIGDATAGLKDQAADRAREYALLGKDRATETLHSVSKMIDDAAATVDDKVGAQYGDYARQAAQTVKGFATSLEDKDVDELFAQVRDAVAKSPGIAIGAAAAVGFVLSRIAKTGFGPAAPQDVDVAFTPDPDLSKKA